MANSIFFECSACDKKLAEVIVINPEPIYFKVKAHCPFCGDVSFVKEVTGIFAVAGHHISKDENEITPLTNLLDVKFHDNNEVDIYVTQAPR